MTDKTVINTESTLRRLTPEPNKLCITKRWFNRFMQNIGLSIRKASGCKTKLKMPEDIGSAR